MKEKLKNSPALQKWFYTQSPLVITRPALRETAACLAYLLLGFLLSCGSLNGCPAPFALALLASVGGGLRGLTCLLGAVAGYLTMQPFSQGLQMASSGILIYVCGYIFGNLWITRRDWFHCLVAGGMTGAVGLIFLLSQPLSALVAAQYGQTVLLAALMPLAYDRLLEDKRRCGGSLLAAASCLAGAAAIPLPGGLCLGCVGGVAVTAVGARRADLPTAAALAVGSGVALDVALGTGGFWALCLGAGGAIGAAVPKRYGVLRMLTFCGTVTGVYLSTDQAALVNFLTLGAGAAVSMLLPGGVIAGREVSAIEESAELVEERLSSGQAAFRRLYDAIGIDPAAREAQERSRVFDKVAVKVCRRCTRYGHCWDKGAGETYRLLQPVLAAVTERGTARREDFPEAFSRECRQLGGLVVALNQELDGMACRNQCRSRSEEERLIVSKSLLYMSRMLEKNARQLRVDQRIPEEAYTARLGVAARGRHGGRDSGDRGASIHTDDGLLYVILCDGAGTGTPAAAESLLAVDALVELIRSGMPPEDAMELLNGMYILRDSGSFSTMDVLELSLLTGQGTLYKWGAAPSYVKSGNVVRRLGSAAPPPGLEIDSGHGAQVLRLNLWSGDILVLVSDGVAGEAAEGLLRDFTGDNVKALATALIDQAEESGSQDDMTAAVVRVEELAR